MLGQGVMPTRMSCQTTSSRCSSTMRCYQRINGRRSGLRRLPSFADEFASLSRRSSSISWKKVRPVLPFPGVFSLTLHRGPTVRRTPLHQPPNEIVPPRSTCSVAEARRRSGSTSRPVNRVLLSAESASRSGSCCASVSSCITIRCPTTGGWAINDSFPCTER